MRGATLAWFFFHRLRTIAPCGAVSMTNACNFFMLRKWSVWTSTGDQCRNGITGAIVIGNGAAGPMVGRGAAYPPFRMSAKNPEAADMALPQSRRRMLGVIPRRVSD